MKRTAPYCPCQLEAASHLGSYDGRGSFAYAADKDPYRKQYADGDFGRFFAPAQMQDNTLTTRGDLKTTLETMALLATTGSGQVRPLAHLLQADTHEQTAYHVWRWIKDNIVYQLDAPGKEQLRTLNRIWADRVSGVDCDDYAIMAAALLIALGRRPQFRVVRFGKDKPFSHVYVVCDGYSIDPVLGLFNTEAPGVYAWQDYDPQTGTTITAAKEMAGVLLGAVNASADRVRDLLHTALRTNAPAAELRKLRYLLFMAQNDTDGLDVLVPWVLRNVADVAKDGTFVMKPGVPAGGALAGLSALLTESADGLGSVPDQLTPCVGPYKAALLSGTDQELFAETAWMEAELGKAKRAARKAKRAERKQARGKAKQVKKAGRQERRAVRRATKGKPKGERKQLRKDARVRTRVATRVAKDAIPRTGAGKFLKSVKRGILKVNPIGVAGRNAYRGLLALNFRGWATRLYRGLMSDKEAAARNIAPDRLARYRMGITRARQVWEGMGGEWNKLVNAVNDGKNKRPLMGGNVSGLGIEPATTAALAAASSVIAALAPVIALFAGKEEGEPEAIEETTGEDGNPVADILPTEQLQTLWDKGSEIAQRVDVVRQTAQRAQAIVQPFLPAGASAETPDFEDLPVDLPAEELLALDTASKADPAPSTAAAATGDGMGRTALFVGAGLLIAGVTWYGINKFAPKRR